MQQNYTPLPVAPRSQKSGLDSNVILIIIALAITIFLGAMLWFTIAQKKQEELDLDQKTQQSQQEIIKDVSVEEEASPTPVASPSAATQ